jgi:hypothetical protein
MASYEVKQEHALDFTFEQGSNGVQILSNPPPKVSSPAYASTYNIERSPPAEEGHLERSTISGLSSRLSKQTSKKTGLDL